LHSSRFLSSCCSFCFCSVDSNLPRCAAFYENSIGCRCSCSCRNETTETKAEKATSALAETAKQNDVSAYLVKIVAFHCLPFQLCATRRIHNVVMKWAHGTHTPKPSHPFPFSTHKYFGQQSSQRAQLGKELPFFSAFWPSKWTLCYLKRHFVADCSCSCFCIVLKVHAYLWCHSF